MNTVKALLYGLHDSYYEALRRRAKRNFRRLGDELRAEAIRREQEALQNAKGVSDA
jgi:hypothetical protein